MSAEWFRSWHGAPTDPKWLGIARKAGVAPGIAVAVAWALMDRASQADDRGSIDGYDADGLACFFGCEAEQVSAIVVAMTDKGMIHDGRFAAWEKRQPKREDSNATQRSRAHRERNATQCNAEQRAGTLDTDTEEDSRSLRSREPRAREPSPAAEPLPPGPPEPALRIEFDMEFWPAWPHKVGRAPALRAFIAARQTASLAEIMDGLARYKSDRPPDRQWLNPATFLNDERFRDDPAPSPVPNGTRPNGHDAIFRALAEQASGPPRQRERDPRPDGIDDAERGGASADFDARGAVQIEADAEP